MAKKFVTTEIPRPEIPEEPEEIISCLKSLKATRGWGILEKIFEDNIKYVETAILEEKDPISSEKLTEKEVNIARIKRSLNIDVLNTIDNYIKAIRENNSEPKNYDPYYNSMEEVEEDRNN